MRFSIKSRVESLIKRGRILAAIRKLQRFTKDKADHQQTFNTLNELESKFIQIEQDSKSGVLDYATFDRERSKIRSAVLDINNEIVELKETRDRKFLIWIKGIITALIITVLGILIQQWFDKSKECPSFGNSDCNLLVFDFIRDDAPGNVAKFILNELQSNEEFYSYVDAEIDPVIENASIDEVRDKVDQCRATFAIHGKAGKVDSGTEILVQYYKKDTLLSDLVNEVHDTLFSMVRDPEKFVKESEFKAMMYSLICLECPDCPMTPVELTEMIKNVNPGVEIDYITILALIEFKRGELLQAENLLTRLIDGLKGGIKVFAMRGKVRDDQKKYEPAYKDYSTYLKKKPENHNVRLKRLASVYNLVTTSGWQNRYGDFIDVAIEDLDLLRGNIPNDQFMSAQRMVQELIKIKDQNLGVIDPVTPDPQPGPGVEKCDYVFQIKSEAGKNVASAVINIQGQVQNSTNYLGMAELNNVPCEELNGQVFTVIKDGFLPYRSQITNDRMVITLEEKPPEVQMCIFRGEVVDENGEPLFSATVTIDGLPRLRTDREGRFNTARLTCAELEGRSFTIVANGYELYNSEISHMEMMYKMVPEKPTEPELCTFRGTIKNDKGVNINGAIVSVYGIKNESSNYNGVFKINNIPCDDFLGRTFYVYADGYETYSSKIRDNQSTITLEPEISMCTFSGNVYDQAGNAIYNATIDVTGQPFITTNRNGYFNTASVPCENLEGRSYSISAEGYQSVRGLIQENKLSVTHTLKKDVANYQIRGRVFNALNNQALQGTGIHINNNLVGRTGMKGEYTHDFTVGVNESSVTVKFSKNGFHSKSISLNLSRIGYNNIELTPLNLNGKIVSNNKPIAGATINVKGLRSQTSNREGDFAFSVPDGFKFPENVQVSKSGFQNATVPITTIYRIELTTNPSIIGHVLDTRVMAVMQQNLYVEATRPFNQGWAIGAQVYLDGKKIGTIQKDGRLSINLTGKVNQSFQIRVVYKGLPGMTKTVKFTHNAQIVKFDLKPVG
ncbi:MAG: hypothetical protein HKN68_18910 [Saprospiraceae bacterium]|nr:hypothetical protein [Saprospiraceae bacterium]